MHGPPGLRAEGWARLTWATPCWLPATPPSHLRAQLLTPCPPLPCPFSRLPPVPLLLHPALPRLPRGQPGLGAGAGDDGGSPQVGLGWMPACPDCRTPLRLVCWSWRGDVRTRRGGRLHATLMPRQFYHLPAVCPVTAACTAWCTTPRARSWTPRWVQGNHSNLWRSCQLCVSRDGQMGACCCAGR